MTLRRRGLPLYYVLILGLLYLPIAVLFLFSINANTTVAFPLKGFTLDWYGEALTDGALIDAAMNSAQVGVASSTLATILGTITALLLLRFEFRGKRVLAALAVLPLIVPYVVLGVALLILFRAFDISTSLLTVSIAHVVVSMPFVVLIVLSRLIGFDRALEDAAMDLGATYPQTLRLVVLPIILPAVVSAWLVAFTVSFDEIALALFLTGRDPTFPVYLAGQIRFTATLPVLIAAAVMLMAGSLLLVLTSERIRRAR
ncbi:MAG TPA: ABC transporter permease [Candidatus Limnocylindrales bacterium]|nr:ABC transporter permease [Candidatus Limnocylindrales bacterium]